MLVRLGDCRSFRGIRKGSEADLAGFDVDPADVVVEAYLASGDLVPAEPPVTPEDVEPAAEAPAPVPGEEAD